MGQELQVLQVGQVDQLDQECQREEIFEDYFYNFLFPDFIFKLTLQALQVDQESLAVQQVLYVQAFLVRAFQVFRALQLRQVDLQLPPVLDPLLGLVGQIRHFVPFFQAFQAELYEK